MTRLAPRSLFGQTLSILLAGLVVSHAVGWWLYTADREEAVRAVGGFAAAQRIATLTRLVEDAPAEWRGRIVAALSDRDLRVTLSDRPPPIGDAADGEAVARAVADYLSDQLGDGARARPRIAVAEPVGPPFGGRRGMGPGHGPGHGPWMHGLGGFRALQVAVPLSDGGWLAFATALPDTAPAFTRQFMVSMALMALVILGVSAWAARRVTAPLAALAGAAERLGRDTDAAPLRETGSIETRRASRAFNDMQKRLRTLIENRTLMLAAISHDLRTPLTLLRLRAEGVADAVERERMLATIAEMDAMVGATLQFARDEATSDAARPTDIAALLRSAVDDMADAGHAATMRASEPIVVDCQPVALKRALANLLENAVKYGGGARAAIALGDAVVEIAIDDDGPGIPEAELERVFEPFHRLETSRGRDTGGVGLGLAIARSIVRAHGGELALRNRPEGGLTATVRLPRRP